MFSQFGEFVSSDFVGRQSTATTLAKFQDYFYDFYFFMVFVEAEKMLFLSADF